MKTQAAALLFALLLLSACAPTVTTHGNLLPKHQLEQVKVQESGREDVERLWGPPTTVGSFDNNKTWYYIGETDKQKGIFRPEVERRQMIKVVFDEQDRVASITSVDPKLGHDVDLVSRTTPSAGKEFTAVQQFVGNLGKFNKADKK